ncbi:plasmid mobilization protein [Plebeiibacterium sediminum]|uniref:MobC family plasmid mobilization relaxosome protein n=1 Tax=Plebeiibacterium sediminum TaxID=2992112 RepID=A0AAE3SGE6_9BACT|nr:plasmid mobilization relaxosome protein MobC [Plebeiobacterium sediminum]MCW3787218.1 MobC family plasmid mobilization relaxosome protein [Plebeiobacterium sediminum]
MARPKKEIDELRIHQVNIRLTKIEYEFANRQAELAGLSVTNWLRRAAFSKRPLKLRVSPMHRAYYKQLIGISNNLNQIARKVNRGEYTKIHSEIVQANDLLKKINKIFTN